MAKSFEDLLKRTCSKDVIIQGYKKTMDYWAEYIGMPDLFKSSDVILPAGFKPKQNIKFFQPCTTITKTTTHFSPPKRRDPSRRWK